MGTRRGQAFALDAFLAGMVFLVTLLLFLQARALADERVARDARANGLELAVADAAGVLFTNGIPTNWEGNPNSIHSIGLLNPDGTLSNAKVSAFFSLARSDHEKARELLGLYRQGTSFDFEISQTDLASGAVVRSTPSIANKANALAISRVARGEDGSLQEIVVLVAEK